MKIMVLSDLHLESLTFEPDQEALRAADVIVLAGDIHPGVEDIVWARQTFEDKPVVYVAGNHEFYGGDWDQTLDQMRQTAKANDVHFLEDDCVTIAGVRFLGCTLWTDFAYFGQYLCHGRSRRIVTYRTVSGPPRMVITGSTSTGIRDRASRIRR